MTSQLLRRATALISLALGAAALSGCTIYARDHDEDDWERTPPPARVRDDGGPEHMQAQNGPRHDGGHMTDGPHSDGGHMNMPPPNGPRNEWGPPPQMRREDGPMPGRNGPGGPMPMSLMGRQVHVHIQGQEQPMSGTVRELGDWIRLERSDGTTVYIPREQIRFIEPVERTSTTQP